MHLKPGIQNFKFRSQHPVGLYVGDFSCHKLKLIVEIDGSIHNLEEVKISDKEKENYFISSGYKVIGFTNKQVHSNIEFILAEINSIVPRKLKKQIVN